MTNLDVRAADEHAAFWAPDTPVYPGGQAVFGNPVWDLNDQRHSVNRPAVYYVCRFDKLPARWQLLAREICMSQVDIRTLRRQVGTVRRYPIAPRTMSELTIRLRVMAQWAGDAGVGLPATWTPDDCDSFVRYVAGRVRHARGVVVAAGDVRSLRTLDPLLSDGGLSFDPWPDVADSEVPKLLGVAYPSPPDGCATPLLPVDAFVAVMTAAFAYTEVFATDILAAWKLREIGDPNVGAKGQRALDLVAAWAAKPDSLVPLLGEAAARKACRPGRPDPFPDEPNWTMLGRLTAVQRRVFVPPSHTAPAATAVIKAMVDDGRFIPGGFYAPAECVESPDGTRRKWRAPYSTFHEVQVDVVDLRNAASIVLLALSGMRDSECQDIRRDSLHQHYGTQALRTHRFKHRFGAEPVSWWVSDEAVTAYRVLEQISEHPTHVIASLTTVGDKRRAGANMAFDRFAAHVNANRGQTGLPEIPAIVQFSPQVLRETFAYYLGRSHELGDIITAFQFGHTRATVTANYQRYRPGDKWNNAFRDGQIDAEVALLDSVAQFTGEAGPIVGRHSDELRADASELRATILTDRDAARRLAAHHAETWHHGEILSCRFDRSTAVCHKLAAAAGITDPGDRPLHDLCVGSGCVNVHFTRRNLTPLQGQRADIAARLTSAPNGSVAHLQAQEELDRVDKTIAELQAPSDRQD